MVIYGIDFGKKDESGKFHVFPTPVHSVHGIPGYIWEDKGGYQLNLDRIEFPVTEGQLRYHLKRRNWEFRPV